MRQRLAKAKEPPRLLRTSAWDAGEELIDLPVSDPLLEVVEWLV